VHQKEKTQVDAQKRRANLGHQYTLNGVVGWWGRLAGIKDVFEGFCL